MHFLNSILKIKQMTKIMKNYPTCKEFNKTHQSLRCSYTQSKSVDKNFQRRFVKNFFPIILAYILGAQKNHLNETVLLSNPQHMFWLRNKKIIFLLRTLNFKSW